MNFIKLHPYVSLFLGFVIVLIFIGLFAVYVGCFLGAAWCTKGQHDTFDEKFWSYNVSSISFSPQSSKIIYADSTEYSIKTAILNSETGKITDQQRLISVPGMRLANPIYSSDGKSVAFVAFPIKEKGENILSNLYTANSDGSTIIKITSNKENQVITKAVFSPDGKYLYFMMSNVLYYRSGFDSIAWMPRDFGLYSVNLETKIVQKLTDISNHANIENLSMDPKGKQLFFNTSVLNLEDNSVKQISLDLVSKLDENYDYQFRNNMFVVHSPYSNETVFTAYMNALYTNDYRYDYQVFRLDVATGKTLQISDLPIKNSSRPYIFFISPGKVAVLSNISPNYDSANVSVINIPVDTRDVEVYQNLDTQRMYISEPDQKNSILNTSILKSASADEKNKFLSIVNTSSSGYAEALFQLNTASKNEFVSKDEDDSKSRVSNFAIPGFEGSAGNIIMADSSGNFSVGVVVYNAEEGLSTMHYYTTVPRWKNALPKTITNWSAQFKDLKFKDLKIIYESSAIQ